MSSSRRCWRRPTGPTDLHRQQCPGYPLAVVVPSGDAFSPWHRESQPVINLVPAGGSEGGRHRSLQFRDFIIETTPFTLENGLHSHPQAKRPQLKKFYGSSDLYRAD